MSGGVVGCSNGMRAANVPPPWMPGFRYPVPATPSTSARQPSMAAVR